MIRLELLYHAEVTLGPPQELGETPQGRRRIIPITGGTFIYVRNDGYRHGPPEAMKRLAPARRSTSVELKVYEVK
jgi:hypothetical protein